MSDIVERLRTWCHSLHAPPASDIMDEAADEIERLRLAIARLADQDATLSVQGGNVTVTMDSTLTDAASAGSLAWIPVSERLPTDGVLVLAYRNRCEYGFRRDGQWIDTLYGGVLANGPTHWMPLPAPPKDAK